MISLYIHWPFCLSKCPYCDFNSHVRQSINEDAWEKSLIHELQRTAELTGSKSLQSIFFGGGTPSLMHPKTVGKIIETATTLWAPSENLEITLEANPNSVEVNRFKELRLNGVNRISVGIQALNDPDLKVLGRLHSAEEAMKAIGTACSTFDRVSFDLIYARQGQTLKAWEQELKRALEFGTNHLSLYQLTIEPGTAFATLYARGDLILPDDNLSADMFELTQSIMNAHEMPAYEVSNHARSGSECRHNLVYWRYQDYVGVGPGAHGRLTLDGKKFATRQKKSPEAWLKSIGISQNPSLPSSNSPLSSSDTTLSSSDLPARRSRGEGGFRGSKDSRNKCENDTSNSLGHGDEEVTELTPNEQDHERLMMGLRLLEGIDVSLLNLPLNETISEKALDSIMNEGYLVQEGTFLKATPEGRQRLNSVLKYLWV